MKNSNSNVLVIDESASIKYNKSEINNDSFKYQKISYLWQLNDIFNKLADKNDIYALDTSECLTLIDSDNNEISLHQYSISKQIEFLKIKWISPGNNSDICISMEHDHHILYDDITWHKSDDNYSFSAESVNKPFDFSNPENVFEYIRKQTVTVKNKIYQGYLPTIGQLERLIQYLDLINYIFDNTGTSQINLDTNFWWFYRDSKCGTWCAPPDQYKRRSSCQINMLPIFGLKQYA